MAPPHFEERSDSAEDDGQPTGEHHDGDQERLGDSWAGDVVGDVRCVLNQDQQGG